MGRGYSLKEGPLVTSIYLREGAIDRLMGGSSMTSITYERKLREIDRRGALMSLIYLRVRVQSISIEGDRRNFVSNALKKKDVNDYQMILQYKLRQYFF